jgi:hypothetical protein
MKIVLLVVLVLVLEEKPEYDDENEESFSQVRRRLAASKIRLRYKRAKRQAWPS